MVLSIQVNECVNSFLMVKRQQFTKTNKKVLHTNTENHSTISYTLNYFHNVSDLLISLRNGNFVFVDCFAPYQIARITKPFR